jgi:hypothetical protein
MAQSESALFETACDLYRAAVEPAVTEIRILNDHLRAHALRVLEHVSTAEVAKDRRGRAHSIHYARMSKAKLRAVIEAAWIDGQIDQETRMRLRLLMERLESEIDCFRRPSEPDTSPPDPGSTPPAEAPVEDAKPSAEAPSVDRVLTPDEAAELRQSDATWAEPSPGDDSGRIPGC